MICLFGYEQQMYHETFTFLSIAFFDHFNRFDPLAINFQ